MLDLTNFKDGDIIELPSVSKCEFMVDNYTRSTTPEMLFDNKNFNLLSKMVIISLYNTTEFTEGVLSTETIQELLSFGEKVTSISYLKVVIDDEEVIYSDGKITHSFQEEANGSMRDLINFMTPRTLRHIINWRLPYNDNKNYILLFNNIIYANLDEFRTTFNIFH